MGTAAFDRAWGVDPPKKGDKLDALWITEEKPGSRLAGLTQPTPAPAHDLHAEFKAGTLGPRMAAENAGEQALDAPPEKLGIGGALATSFANTARGLPGVAAIQDALRAVVRRVPYAQAKGEIDQATSRIPAGLSTLQRMVGSLPAAEILPKNPAAAGATLGAADQVLSDDPTTGIGGRVVGGLLGAAIGGATGHAVGTGTTLARTVKAPKSSTNILRQEAARSASADANYGKALAEGQGKTETPAISRALAKPDIAEIHKNILDGRSFENAAPNSPEVLDAIYKVLSDQHAQVQRGLDLATPTRPNIGRFTREDINLAKEELLNAMSGRSAVSRPVLADATALDIGGLPRSTPADFRASIPGRSSNGKAIPATGPVPAPMPSYRGAVDDYATRSGQIDATREGQDVLRSAIGKGVTTGKNLDRTTPEAFAQWADRATGGERNAAAEGVLGATKEDLLHHPLRNLLGFRATGKAGSLLRSIDTPQQRVIDLLTKAGLMSANAAVQ